MPREVAIGIQDYSKLIEQECFFVDKTMFIKDWWKSRDDVTLITRPRRFGKTLNMSMLECFFSTEYANRSDLFEEFKVWKDENMRKEQGTWPVISLTFSRIKRNNFEEFILQLSSVFHRIFLRYNDIVQTSTEISEDYRKLFTEYKNSLNDTDNKDRVKIIDSVNLLSEILYRHYHRKVIILLDEYDTPMLEAYANGYWDELASFMRSFFNSTFKDNPYMHRAVLTGITRVSKESLFSDFNNLIVCSMFSEKYQSCFGFTEEEVFAAMDEFGYTNKDEVKLWYDGFTIGNQKDIYNPWSIINFLDDNELKPYWANTSSNALVSKLVKEGNTDLKMDFEILLEGGSVSRSIKEEMVYSQLNDDGNAVWSLLATSGYLKIDSVNNGIYELSVVNYEVMQMFNDLILAWFRKDNSYSRFVNSMLKCDLDDMNDYLSDLIKSVISSFDSAADPDEFKAPEKFYHGLVLGLLVDLRGRYALLSNRESGYGRYDIMLVPSDKNDKAFIIEFKVLNTKRGEKTLEEVLEKALNQIEERQYECQLLDQGISKEKIVKLGFAFEGRKVLIGRA